MHPTTANRFGDGEDITLLKILRGRSDATPVIILTAHMIRSLAGTKGLNTSVNDYLVKPFELDEFSARMLAVSRR